MHFMYPYSVELQNVRHVYQFKCYNEKNARTEYINLHIHFGVVWSVLQLSLVDSLQHK